VTSRRRRPCRHREWILVRARSVDRRKRNPELAQSPLVFPDLKEAHNFKTFSPKDEAEIEAAFQRATGA